MENSAFTALDPLGDKEKKTGKDMFKNFQLAKPPAIPARKGEITPGSAPPPNKEAGAFDEYFSNKVGLAQDAADHDDFDINQISSLSNNGKPHRFIINCSLSCATNIYKPICLLFKMQKRSVIPTLKI